MRRDEIRCSKKGCENSHRETGFNSGHPGWGEVIGVVDPAGENPHLCPECMAEIKTWLNKSKGAAK